MLMEQEWTSTFFILNMTALTAMQKERVQSTEDGLVTGILIWDLSTAYATSDNDFICKKWVINRRVSIRSRGNKVYNRTLSIYVCLDQKGTKCLAGILMQATCKSNSHLH